MIKQLLLGLIKKDENSSVTLFLKNDEVLDGCVVKNYDEKTETVTFIRHEQEPIKLPPIEIVEAYLDPDEAMQEWASEANTKMSIVEYTFTLNAIVGIGKVIGQVNLDNLVAQ